MSIPFFIVLIITQVLEENFLAAKKLEERAYNLTEIVEIFLLEGESKDGTPTAMDIFTRLLKDKKVTHFFFYFLLNLTDFM